MRNSQWIDVVYRQTDMVSPTMNYHYHDGFEIFQIWTDDGHVLVEDKVYPMKNGYIYIVNSLELHRTNPAPSMPYIRSKLTFSPTFIRGILEQIGHLYLLEPFMNKDRNFSHNIVPDDHITHKMDQLFANMAHENRMKSIGYFAALQVYLVEMLLIIYRWYSSNRDVFPMISSPAHHHMEAAISYINNHLSDNITIENICNQLHLSKYYLCHLFKEITGLTIMQYIVEKRIGEAKKLLLSSHKPICSIAMETGFNSFSVFSRTFKRITGFSPSYYRKQYSLL